MNILNDLTNVIHSDITHSEYLERIWKSLQFITQKNFVRLKSPHCTILYFSFVIFYLLLLLLFCVFVGVSPVFCFCFVFFIVISIIIVQRRMSLTLIFLYYTAVHSLYNDSLLPVRLGLSTHMHKCKDHDLATYTQLQCHILSMLYTICNA